MLFTEKQKQIDLFRFISCFLVGNVNTLVYKYVPWYISNTMALMLYQSLYHGSKLRKLIWVTNEVHGIPCLYIYIYIYRLHGKVRVLTCTKAVSWFLDTYLKYIEEPCKYSDIWMCTNLHYCVSLGSKKVKSVLFYFIYFNIKEFILKWQQILFLIISNKCCFFEFSIH